MSGTKGEITREHTVWCGLCVCWMQRAVRTKTAMAHCARKLGWVFTRKNGWVCPICKEKV